MEHKIVIVAKQKVELHAFEPPRVERGQIAARAHYSLMSTGTETISYLQNFAPGSAFANFGKLPMQPGYASVGEVVEVGPDVKGFKPGDTVAYRPHHASYHVLDAERFTLIPDGIELKNAAWFALAKIAFMGALAAQHTLGDVVLVIGAGPIGQMSARWALAAGAERVVVADPVELRLGMAMHGGATAVVSQPIEEYLKGFGKDTKGLFKTVIDTTGNAKVFQTALLFCRDHGRMVLLGNTGFPDEQHLISELMRRGICLVGAHDRLNDDIWNNQSIAKLFFALVRSGRFNLSGLNTHVFHPTACTEAYETASHKRAETMGILFDWQGRETTASLS